MEQAGYPACFFLAVAAILACDGWPRVRWARVLGAGALIGLAAAVRVGGIVLFGFALALWLGTLVLRSGPSGGPGWPARKDLLRLLGAWAAAVVVGWTAMVAFWPWAMLDPLRNPFRAASRFSRFWEDMLLFYDGQLVPAAAVSRFYLPYWFALHDPGDLPRGRGARPRRAGGPRPGAGHRLRDPSAPPAGGLAREHGH